MGPSQAFLIGSGLTVIFGGLTLAGYTKPRLGWTLIVFGTLLLLVGLGGMLPEAWQRPVLAVCAALAALTLLVTWWRRVATRNKLRDEKQRIEAERLQGQEERRAKWREPCRTWEEFCFDAGRLVATMDNFRYEYEPKNWQTIMVIKASLALSLAHSLLPSHRLKAEQLIQPFEKYRANAVSAQDFQTDLYLLREWLRGMSDYYRNQNI